MRIEARHGFSTFAVCHLLLHPITLEFHPLPIDVLAEMREPESEALFSGGGNPIAFLRWLRQAGRKAIKAVAPAALEGAKGADLIVGSGIMNALGAILADHLRVPRAHAWWALMLAARDFLFTSAETAPPRLHGWANRAVFLAFEQAMRLATRDVLRPARELYGLPPAPFKSPLGRAVARGETLFLAYSGALLPRSREWPENVEVTANARDTVTAIVRSCAGFWTPASREAPRTQAAGVQKAPGHEVAGSWEAAGQRALWGFQVSAEFAGGRDTGASGPGCLDAGRARA